MEAKDCCDITISIDCDGQDDINAMDQMIEEYYDGCEIVYGIAWKNSCRMGKYGMYCCFYRRSTVDLHRGDWGVYWENIYGSEAQTQIYNQREDNGTRRKIIICKDQDYFKLNYM